MVSWTSFLFKRYMRNQLLRRFHGQQREHLPPSCQKHETSFGVHVFCFVWFIFLGVDLSGVAEKNSWTKHIANRQKISRNDEKSMIDESHEEKIRSIKPSNPKLRSKSYIFKVAAHPVQVLSFCPSVSKGRNLEVYAPQGCESSESSVAWNIYGIESPVRWKQLRCAIFLNSQKASEHFSGFTLHKWWPDIPDIF